MSVIISSFAAYSMVRFRYRFHGIIRRLILFAYLTPPAAVHPGLDRDGAAQLALLWSA